MKIYFANLLFALVIIFAGSRSVQLQGAELSGSEVGIAASSVYKPGLATSQQVTAAMTEKAFLEKVADLCGQIVSAPPEDMQTTLSSVHRTLGNDIDQLTANISKVTDSKIAQGWKEYLLLDTIKKEMAAKNLSSETVEASIKAFDSKAEGLDKPIFVPVLRTLELLDALNKEVKGKARLSKDDEKAFANVCEKLPQAVCKYIETSNGKDGELLTVYLDNLKYYRPGSAKVDELVKLITNYFSAPNVIFTASSALLRTKPIRNFTENLTVKETIRGSAVRGTGTAKGEVYARFVPNNDRAEIRLSLSSDVSTKTVAYRQGVSVHSNNTGTVSATKSIYIDGTGLDTSRATGNGKMKSHITNIDSGRGRIGQHVVENRVRGEQPYSQAESTRKMELRMAERFDETVNEQVATMNGSLKDRIIAPLQTRQYYPRQICTCTTANRVCWTALVGNELQPGLSRSHACKPDGFQSDVTFRLHESCPNNTTFFTFSGARVSQREINDEMKSLFPELMDNKNTGMANSAPKTAAKTVPAREEPELWFSFFEENPITVVFADNIIKVAMRVREFEKDSNVYPGLNVDIEYQIVKKQNGYYLERSKLDAFPGSLKPGDTIPARFQAIRTIVLNAFKDQLKESYEIPPMDLPFNKESKTGDDGMVREGTLVPIAISTQNGWLSANYQFNPISKK